MAKKLIILKHGGGELANQLWNYLSIYAFGLETDAKVENPSFFEYHSFFNFLNKENVATRLFALCYTTPRRRSHPINKCGRVLYSIIVKLRTHFSSGCIYSSENSENKDILLPPTKPLPEEFESCETLYMTGWLFRNQEGLRKYRREIKEAFAPAEKIQKKVESIIEPLRQKYEKIIGVHIRQADYATFKGGMYLVSQDSVRACMDQLIVEKNFNAARTVFIITSDGHVVQKKYQGLNVIVSKENAVTDLFLLAKTDFILGSHSTFNGFAAWYGGIERKFFDESPAEIDVR